MGGLQALVFRAGGGGVGGYRDLGNNMGRVSCGDF